MSTTYQITDKFLLGLNVATGTQKGDYQGTGGPSTAKTWGGFAIYPKYDISSTFSIGARYESFNNQDAVRALRITNADGSYTGVSVSSITITPTITLADSHLLLKPELRIDTYRASGAGGQHINKTDSAVRITHLPTNIVVECQDGRSQHKNKAQAMSVLAARIRDKQMQEQQSKQAATRKSLIGSGDRSGRIRTYNFPQGRITDHRINLTLYKIEQIMDGDLNDLCSALISEHQAEQLAAMGE